MPFSMRGTAHFTAVSTFGAAQSFACSALVATLSLKSRAVRFDITVNPFDRFVCLVLAYDLTVTTAIVCLADPPTKFIVH